MKREPGPKRQNRYERIEKKNLPFVSSSGSGWLRTDSQKANWGMEEIIS